MQERDFIVVYFRRCKNGVIRRFSRSFVFEFDARTWFDSIRNSPGIVEGYLFSYSRFSDLTSACLEGCF